jgi:hypothetical protein
MVDKLKRSKILLVALAIFIAFGVAGLSAPSISIAKEASQTKYDKGMKYYYAGKFAQAEKLLKQYINETADPKAYFRLGYALYKQGKHDEANKYFQQSYLVTPDYTPTPELEKKHERLKHVRPEGYYEGKIKKDIKPEPKPEIPEGMEVVKQESTLALPVKPDKPNKKEEPKSEEKIEPKPELKEEAPVAAPVPAEVKPEEVKKPVEEVKPPEPRKRRERLTPTPEPTEMEMLMAALAAMAAFLIPILAVFGLIYLLVSFAIFKLAKKTNLGKASKIMAFIPVLQLIPFVQASGKPIWWAALMLVPIVQLFAMVLVLMDLAETLGKSRKTALIIFIVNLFIPIVLFGFILYLAFSKSAQAGAGLAAVADLGATDLSGEPDLDLPDIPDDFDDMGDIGGDDDFDQTVVGDFDEITGGDDMDFNDKDF